jgi:AcrR family transcriptional regulator
MTSRPAAKSPKLNRDVIVNAALAFLDREGWDALTINALATQLGTKGPSLYNHVSSLEDLRRTVRMRVIDDILQMLSTVGAGRTRDDAVMVMASAYRSYAHHHPGRYSAFTRMPLGGDDPEYAAASRAAAAPVIDVLASFGLAGEDAFYAALEFWAALHGFVLLEMTGMMNSSVIAAGETAGETAGDAGSDPRSDSGAGRVDTDAVFTGMVLRLAAGMAHRHDRASTS